MPDGNDNKKKYTPQDFVNIDRGKLYGEPRPATLAVNRDAGPGSQGTTTAKPVDVSTQDMPVGGTGTQGKEKKSVVDEILGAPSYEEALAISLRKREEARQNLQTYQKTLAGKVQFNSKGEPTKVNIGGVWTDIDDVIDMPDDIESSLDGYYGALFEYQEADKRVDLVKELKGIIGKGSGSGAGKVIDEEEEFRKKVKFYADLAKDILSMQKTAVNTTFEGLKDTADLMGKIKDKGVLVPGQQVYIPPTPQQNMWKPLADMTGLPMGVGGGKITREIYNNPDEYAKALGVPGYAKGTPVQNKKSGIIGKDTMRLSKFLNKQTRR